MGWRWGTHLYSRLGFEGMTVFICSMNINPNIARLAVAYTILDSTERHMTRFYDWHRCI